MEKAPPSFVHRLNKVCTTIEVAVGIIALVVIFVLVFFQALQRYLPIDQIAWTGEVARFSMIILTFSAAGVLVTTKGHIALELIDAIPNQLISRVLHTLSYVLFTLIGVGLTYAAYELVRTQGIIMSPVLKIKMSLIYIPVMIGLISLTIRSALMAVGIALYGWKNPPIVDDPELAPVTTRTAVTEGEK